MFNSLYAVKNMDKDECMYFEARTAHEALNKLIYTLNLNKLDKKAKVMLSSSASYLWAVHNGETWAVENKSNREL